MLGTAGPDDPSDMRTGPHAYGFNLAALGPSATAFDASPYARNGLAN
ncbi:hypothetical protein [Phyllobacterium ifriqiyense]